MTTDEKIFTFLSQYEEPVFSNALKLRILLLDNLPAIIEQIDIPARMIAYCYGAMEKFPICEIKSAEQITSPEIKNLLNNALVAYEQHMGSTKNKSN